MAAFCFRRLPLLILLVALLAGCAAPRGVADLRRLTQSATAWLPAAADTPLVDAAVQAGLDRNYDERFFRPWTLRAATLPVGEAFWGIASYGGRQGYGENLQPLDATYWQGLVAALQADRYPSLARPAITVRNTACRVFPTQRPFFLDPALPGEGFPFDYFQNSALWAGTPLLVTHVSADGAWYFAEAGFVSGWLAADAVAWVGEEFASAYRTGRYAALLDDNLTLRDEAGEFLVQSHLGALFPVAGEGADGLLLLVPQRDADGAAVLRSARIAAGTAALKPLPLTPRWIAGLADRMIGQPYGWGGLFEDRDCSATMRDLFTPFGVWLPRNSAEQARRGGKFRDLSALAVAEKRSLLLQEGVPFYTLISFKGHIGLYLGPDPASGEPLLLHNFWGVRTRDWRGREGREVVGRLAVTTLRPGEERRDVAADRFYSRVLGMTVLPH